MDLKSGRHHSIPPQGRTDELQSRPSPGHPQASLPSGGKPLTAPDRESPRAPCGAPPPPTTSSGTACPAGNCRSPQRPDISRGLVQPGFMGSAGIPEPSPHLEVAMAPSSRGAEGPAGSLQAQAPRGVLTLARCPMPRSRAISPAPALCPRAHTWRGWWGSLMPLYPTGHPLCRFCARAGRLLPQDCPPDRPSPPDFTT